MSKVKKEKELKLMTIEALKEKVAKIESPNLIQTDRIFGNERIIFWKKGVSGTTIFEVKKTNGESGKLNIKDVFCSKNTEVKLIQEEIENEVSVVDAGSTDIGDKSEWDILLSKKYKFGADAKKLIGDCRENLLIVDSKNRRGFPKYQLRFMIEFLGSDYKNIKTFIYKDEKENINKIRFSNDFGAVLIAVCKY